MFPIWHIALTALLTALLTAVLAWFSGRTSRSITDAFIVGIAAGLGILLWRLGANTPDLNADPLPGVSPADVLSAPMAYLAVGVAAGVRGQGAPERWALAQSLAAVIALLVNIVTI